MRRSFLARLLAAIARRRDASRIRPRRIRLEASSHCQLRCPSCPTTTGHIHPAIGSGFLKFDDFRRLVDSSPRLREVEISNYGEVFLNPELLRILQYAHQNDVVISIANGANLNHIAEEVIEGLVKYRVSAITCSIDGASREAFGESTAAIVELRLLALTRIDLEDDLPGTQLVGTRARRLFRWRRSQPSPERPAGA
jgi:molybdenum cofactor biosynthesis enzyme MoaA